MKKRYIFSKLIRWRNFLKFYKLEYLKKYDNCCVIKIARYENFVFIRKKVSLFSTYTCKCIIRLSNIF